MILCNACDRYMGPGENEVILCDWCVENGYYLLADNSIRYRHIDDTPLAQKIVREMEGLQDE